MIAQRVKALRKDLHLSQVEFGKKIGLSQGHLTSIESGKKNITDRTIATICHVFQANEQWLRDGTGSMYAEARNDLLCELADAYLLEEAELIAVEAFLLLSPRDRKSVLSFMDSLAEKLYARRNTSGC